MQMDQLYDALSALVDRTPKDQRETALAKLAVALAEKLGDYEEIVRTLED
jgi:hypothetical protein